MAIIQIKKLVINIVFVNYYENYSFIKIDGQPYDKPRNLRKCSHGGIMDRSSSTIEAIGGINKDSGYLIFSPHAHLHLEAAYLAINHTEIFFNKIRKQIGDKVFAKFLLLEIDRISLKLSSSTDKCSTSNIDLNQIILFVNILILFLYF